MDYIIIIPIFFNLSIFKNKKIIIYIYNKNYFYILKLNNIFLKNFLVTKINNNLNFITFSNFFFTKKIFTLKSILLAWSFYFFKKIKFSGKGFRIKKNKKKKNFLLEFNKSHITIFLIKKIILKKIKKSKFLNLYINKKYLTKINKQLVTINFINKYTKRGLRNTRQIFKKKTNQKNLVN